MVIVLAAALALQTPPAQPVKPEDPGAMAPQTMWSGCLQAGSTPSTYGLNLDAGSAVAGPNGPVSLGDPFVAARGQPGEARRRRPRREARSMVKGKALVARRSRAPRRAQARSAGGGTRRPRGPAAGPIDICATCACSPSPMPGPASHRRLGAKLALRDRSERLLRRAER